MSAPSMQAALSGGRALLQDGADPPRADTALGVGSGVIALAVIGFLCALTCLLGTKTTSSGAISLASALVFGASLLILLQAAGDAQPSSGEFSWVGNDTRAVWRGVQAFLMAAAAAGGLAGVLVTHVAKPMHAKRLPPTYAEAAVVR